MITICIPVYNFDVTSLVNELSDQAKRLNIPHELIIIDDCSQHYREKNKKSCEKFKYIELSENIGRAKIRNLFLNYAQYEYLLFLDCDSLIGSTSFLSRYVGVINASPNVVCGGRIYNNSRPSRDKMLRWKYGFFRESRPCEERQKHPNQSFMTNNFLIKRKVLKQIKFDERIKDYGHEDTLFGLSLKKENFAITHIDNPVINGDLEQNSEYLRKTKDGIINLIKILDFVAYDKTLIDSITILNFYQKVRKIDKLIHASFVVFKPFIVYLLSRGYVNLYVFDYFKLGILIENLTNKRRKYFKKVMEKGD